MAHFAPRQKHTSPFRDHHGCHLMCLETQWQRFAFAVTTVAGPRPVFLPWKVRAALCFYNGQLGPEAQKNRSLVDDVTFYSYVCTEEQTLSDCLACAPPRTSFTVFSPSSPTSRSPAKQGVEHHIATTGPTVLCCTAPNEHLQCSYAELVYGLPATVGPMGLHPQHDKSLICSPPVH